jgi:hypothetical protein
MLGMGPRAFPAQGAEFRSHPKFSLYMCVVSYMSGTPEKSWWGAVTAMHGDVFFHEFGVSRSPCGIWVFSLRPVDLGASLTWRLKR